MVATSAPNAKAGVLAELARRARYPLLLVNDSDIVVDPATCAPWPRRSADPGVGLVTCLYRAARRFAGRRALEALGIATEFAPSVLVARLLGVAEFALGSTMVFRAGDLRAASAASRPSPITWPTITSLGARITATRLPHRSSPRWWWRRDLGAERWAQVWRHQLRWSRTIRVSRPSGLLRLCGHPRHPVGAGGVCRPAVVGRRGSPWRFA